MTRTHTATIEIRRWKAHTCIGCGCRYAYLLHRKVAHGGTSPARAAEKARIAAARTLTTAVDRQPCPTCGLYQPDMIAGPRRSLHGFLLMVTVLAFALIAALYLGEVVQADRALMIALVAAAVLGGLDFLIDLRNPNCSLEANRQKAETEIAAGRVRILQPGMALPSGFDPPGTRGHGVAAVGLVLAAFASLSAPELLRERAGWPLNADAYPPVVGPGEETRLYLPETISSIKGYWSGRSQVTAHWADDPQGPEIRLGSSTSDTNWGREIFAKDEEKSNSSRLWVRVRMPPDNSCAGKTLDCKIELAVAYPVMQNKNNKVFQRVSAQFTHPAILRLAAPHSGARYRSWWWSGFAGGTALLLASILTRLFSARSLSRAASPNVLLDE